MSRSQLGTAGIVFIALLAFPRVSSAGLMDYIHEMSGPELFSVLLLDCEYHVASRQRVCYIYDKKLSGDRKALQGSNLWLALAGGAYTSTGTDSKTGEYGWLENHMLAFEPMLKWRTSGTTQHGVGATYDFLFGRYFRRFDNWGLKVVPVAFRVRSNSWVISSVRFYPNKFTTEDFDAKRRGPEDDGKKELVIGLAYEWRSR